MHAPREPHRALIKRILRYVKGTLSSGIHIGAGPVDKLTAYSDADWAGCPDSRRSTSGYCVYSVTLWSPGPPNAKPQCHVPAPRRSIVLWPMWWPNAVGSDSSSRSSTYSYPLPLLSSVTMSAPST